MKQYVVDELRPEDHEKLKDHLDTHFGVAEFDGLYWMTLDEEMHAGIQQAHTDCQPYYFALELLPDRLICELLVRTNKQVRCQCIQYATESQRNWLIKAVDALFDHLEIVT